MAVYACADLHGCYWAWEQIKKILQPGDVLYFLGDAADRGTDGWTIMKELLNNSQVIYLMGNHERMFLNNWGNYDGHSLNDCKDYRHLDNYIWNWYGNGGEITDSQFIQDSISGEEKVSYIRQLNDLPFITVYHNENNEDIILCHAGCDYHDIDNLTEEAAIWDRSHYLNSMWDGPNNTYIIHGHTPIPLLIQEQEKFNRWYNLGYNFPKDEMLEGAYWYADGHKCCIDCGVVFTDQTVLLNLDTWEEIIINKE